MRAAIAAASIFVAAAVPASATPPVREPVPDFEIPDDGGAFCGFPISITVAQNKEVQTTFSDGSYIITGVFKAQLTNLADPSKSIVVNASGPIRTDETGTGSQLFFLADPREFFGQGIWLLHGNSAVTRDEEGLIVDVDYTGTVSGNLCDAIA